LVTVPRPGIEGVDMLVITRSVAAVLAAFLAFGSFTLHASAAQGTNGTDVIIQLRQTGDIEALSPIRSCLADKLSQMPDVKVATVPTDGVRFIVDIVAARNDNKKISASLVVAEIFPMEEFRSRMKEGEDADALLARIEYYTLLRLHEIVRARSYETLCLNIIADLGDRVLSKEYTERDD
jgi:DNA-binding winged helix-turn-helix (wHTH) protein